MYSPVNSTSRERFVTTAMFAIRSRPNIRTRGATKINPGLFLNTPPINMPFSAASSSSSLAPRSSPRVFFAASIAVEDPFFAMRTIGDRNIVVPVISFDVVLVSNGDGAVVVARDRGGRGGDEKPIAYCTGKLSNKATDTDHCGTRGRPMRRRTVHFPPPGRTTTFVDDITRDG